MGRGCRIPLAILFLAACWWAMMAVHELGHVLGAFATGGTVTKVVLHPLKISRTDVSPNPHPGCVVWSGPLAGVGIPLVCAAFIPKRYTALRKAACFFAGFCLIANGAYIAAGAADLVGDCREMFQTGTPRWLMIVFGAMAIVLGLYLWHRLGSIRAFLRVAPKQ